MVRYNLCMGYYGKLEEKELAQKLRAEGLSYGEIQNKVKVSKDTISRWCRDIILSPKQTARLIQNKLNGATKGRMIGAKKQQEARIRLSEKLFHKGVSKIGKLSKKERFMAGVGLYIGDGGKGDKRFAFANSDPKTIKFMSQWLTEFYDISPNKMAGQIWIHEDLNEKQARKFWSNLTKIPEERIYKSYIAKNKVNSRKVRKQLHEHGVFSLLYHSSSTQREMLGLMAGILS
jgi:predicted transcriptional regulator YheO